MDNKKPEWSDNMSLINKKLLDPKITFEESQQLYEQWAMSGTYDKMLTNNKEYTALKMLSGAMTELYSNPDSVRILDVGAGTGLLAEELQKFGFTSCDGLDPCKVFVKIAESKGNIYGRVIHAAIGEKGSVPVEDDTYDAVVTSGSFGPGAITCSGIPEIIRVVKPGGHVVITMREEFFRTVEDYAERLQPLFESLEKQGRWKQVKRQIYKNHFAGKDGILLAFQIC